MKRPLATIDAFGCDVGGTTTKLVRLRRGKITASSAIPSLHEDASSFVRALADGLGRLPNPATSPRESAPVGVALPGHLDARRRGIVRLSNLPFLDGVPLAARLERSLRSRVVLDADSNAGAVSESRLGAGRGEERVLYVTLGTGVGAALAVRGRPVRVRHHTVGQIAHLPLATEGPRCPCGRRGCAESLLSSSGILRRARHSGAASPRELFEAAESGDRDAIDDWRRTGELLGALLRILIALFSPDVAVVGGGVSAAAAHFLPAADEHLARTLPGDLRGAVRIERARLGPHSGAAGAAILAAEAGSRCDREERLS